MDTFRNLAGEFNPLDLKTYLDGVSWPIGKDDLMTILKQHHAPDAVTTKVRDADASQFTDLKDLLSKIGF
jgi:hypothetical protein